MRAHDVTLDESTTTAAISDGVASDVILECRGLTKRFPGVLALDGVDFEVRRGEIHALVGQNGAGKTTLVKLITGVYRSDAGDIHLFGTRTEFKSPHDAAERGIAIVHQDSPLVPQFDVTRNTFLGHETVGLGGVLDFGGMRKETAAALAQVGAQFDPDTQVADLAVGQREQVAIAAALVQRPSLMIFDEPTASLGAEDVERLFSVIRSLKAQGVTIVYISHHLDEVFRLAERVTVLRDGRRVGTLEVGGTSREAVVHLMIGRDLGDLQPHRSVGQSREPVLSVIDLHQGTAVRGVNLVVRHGEILGLAGVVGAGRTETALTVFGALARDRGRVAVDDRDIAPTSPNSARADGIALIPEDRRREGLITDLSVRDNLSLASLSRWSLFGVMRDRAERLAAQDLVGRMRIATPSVDQPVRTLSGGNQQKVVIGRWFATDAKVYLFDEPTTGVDVGARVEIHNQMRELADRGAGVLFISSDFDELLDVCDRIAVIKKGKVVREFDRGEADMAELLRWATGASVEPSEAPEAPDGSSKDHPALQAGVFRLSASAPEDGTSVLSRTDESHGASLSIREALVRLIGRRGTVLGMALTVLLIAVTAPGFMTIDNLFVILKQGSILALVALPLTIVLIAGGFDMSVGAVSQLTANLAAGTIIAGAGTAAALAVGGATGMAFGLANAILIVVIGMPPFVATLQTMFIAIGLSFAYNGGHALTLSDQPTFFFLGQGYIGPVPFVFILLVVLTLVLHLFLKRTRTGLRMYAVGENLAAARLRGVSRSRALFVASVLGSTTAGVAGVLMSSYSYGASALATGFDFLITALAAAFLGSALSRTSELDVAWTIVAAMFITSLNTGLILYGATNQVLPGIQGLILIAAITIGVVRRREIGQVLIF